MKHKYIAILLALMLLFTGCAQQKHYEVRQDLSIYFTNADRVIASVRESLRKHDSKIIISYQSHRDNMQDIGALVRELMGYALDETENPTEGDYLFHQYGGYEMHYSYQKQNDIYRYEIEIIPDYYTTLTQEAEVSQKMQEVLRSLDFHVWTSDYRKIKLIYEYICEHVEYDLVHRKNEHYHLKSTAYGALIYERAVCQGYAVLLYRMLRESGIDARIITGTAQMDGEETEFHAWNIVRIGDSWYNLDATWDARLQTEDYFLKSDDDFPAHQRDEAYLSESFCEEYPMAEKSY